MKWYEFSVASTSSKRINPLFNAAKRQKKDASDSGQSDSDEEDFSDEDSDDSDEESEEENAAPEEDEEDPLIKRLKEAKEKKVRQSPPDIKLKDEIMDISFHPERNIIATALINGKIIRLKKIFCTYRALFTRFYQIV